MLTTNDRACEWKSLWERFASDERSTSVEHLPHMVGSRWKGKATAYVNYTNLILLPAKARKNCWKIFLVHFTCLSISFFCFLVLISRGEKIALHGWSKILIDQTAIPSPVRRFLTFLSWWISLGNLLKIKSLISLGERKDEMCVSETLRIVKWPEQDDERWKKIHGVITRKLNPVENFGSVKLGRSLVANYWTSHWE